MTVEKKAPKDFTALPLQRVHLHATIVRRSQTPEALAASKERTAQIVAARAKGEQVPDDDGDDDDVYDVSLSSDTPINRGYYTETLDHSKDAVDLSRAAGGINLLWNHDPSQPIGRLSGIKSNGHRLSGQMKFFSTPSAQEKRTMVDEGLREVSIGYAVHSYDYTPGTAEAGDQYKATRWQLLEGSIAPVPADNSVGVGMRADMDGKKFPVLVRDTTPPPAVIHQEPKMTEQERAAAEAADKAKAKLPTDIAQLARKHGMADKTAEWLEAGHTLEQVREIILDAKGTREETLTKGGPAGGGVDLSATEQRQYSYARAIAVAADQAEGRRPDKCLELEVSHELERTMPGTYKRHGGMYVPTSLRNSGIKEYNRSKGMSAATREMLIQASRAGVIDSQTVNALKEVVFTEYGGELIEILRNIALVVSMGARVLSGLSSPIAFPRQLTDAVATWVAENPGTNVAGSNPTTDLVTLSPRTLMASSAYSRQLLVQASIDVEAMVRGSIAAAHALAWDLAAMHGTGQNNQPLGIYNQVGVATVDFSNAAYGNGSDKIAYTGCVQMEVLVANANALLGTLGYLTTPGIAGDAKTTLKFPAAAIAQGGVLWNGKLQDGELNGYTAKATNQVSKTMGAGGLPSGGSNNGLIYGNWADVIIGQFGGAMEMIVDPYSLKKQGLIEVTSFQMADVAIRHPGSFAVATNMLA
jgi:HK97 family phage major capsid protein/HK97 family phage prohead protease